MPSIFHWKRPKRLAGISIKLAGTKSSVDQDTGPKLEPKDEPDDNFQKRLSSDLPYIDRSSSPSSISFPLKSKSDSNGMAEKSPRSSPQRPILNPSPQRDYFPRPDHQTRVVHQSDVDHLGRVQRNVHFDDEESNEEGIGGNHQNVATSGQSNSTPTTPSLTASREPFLNAHGRFGGDNNRESLNTQQNKQVVNGHTVTFAPHQLDAQPFHQNQDSSLHGYPPPSYTTATQQSQRPILQLDFPMSGESKSGYRHPSPQSPLGADIRLTARAALPEDSYFSGSDVVPPRPPRQQQQAPFQRSNSTGSSNGGVGSRAQHLLSQLGANHYPKENRANIILQQLRADDGAQSESDVSTNEPIYRGHEHPKVSFSRGGNVGSSMMHSKGVVYLEFNKEVKRSNLPTRLCTFEQIKSLFLRSFPNLTGLADPLQNFDFIMNSIDASMERSPNSPKPLQIIQREREFRLQFLNQEHVKIYIADRQQSSMVDNVLFYELEDLNDVKDQTVLKIHQSQVYRSPPPPLRFTDQLPTDYISEPEVEERARRYASYRARPASALPDSGRPLQYTSNNSPAPLAGANKSQGPMSSHHFETYYDPYYSDASSQGPRSGSTTPIIDKETRQRVETMERQLAGLSTLVRSALIHQGAYSNNKDLSPDIMDLGRRLFEMQSDAAERFGLSTNSNTSSMYSTVLNGKQLIQVRRGVRDMKIDLNELRDFIEIDKKDRSDLIRDVFSKIASQLNEFMKQQEVLNVGWKIQNQLKQQKSDYNVALKTLEEALQSLENKIEQRRMDVLSKNHKLKMLEVDDFQSELRSIDQQNGQLRGKADNSPCLKKGLDQYMTLEDDACKAIDHLKEAIDEEAEFLRREPQTMDQCNRRYQALNNMLATMRKLALVQDPSVYDRSKALLGQQSIPNSTDKLPPKVAPKPNGVLSNGVFHHSTNTTSNGNKNEQLPPLPHSPQRVTSPNPIRSVSATSTPHMPQNGQQLSNASVLDSILDELNHTASTLPKILDQPSDQQIALNGKTAKVSQRPAAKQVIEASATLTLKESGQQPGKIVPPMEKYDNINDDQPQTQPNKAKTQNETDKIASVDPRRRFVTTEKLKFRPTNSGHVILSASVNGR